MTEHLQEQRGVASVAAIRHYDADPLCDAFRERDLRLAIAGAVGTDLRTQSFTKRDLKTLADHFGIEYDRFTSGVDLRRQICAHCNCDYEEFASDTLTKPQLAYIARRLAKDGDFETEWTDPTTASSTSGWWVPSKRTLSSAFSGGVTLGIAVYLTNLVAEELTINGKALPRIDVAGLVASFLVVLIVLAVMVLLAAYGPRGSFQA
jgi:hypothetical protein